MKTAIDKKEGKPPASVLWKKGIENIEKTEEL